MHPRLPWVRTVAQPLLRGADGDNLRAAAWVADATTAGCPGTGDLAGGQVVTAPPRRAEPSAREATVGSAVAVSLAGEGFARRGETAQPLCGG